MAEAHYQRTEPPHCPTCSCGMTGDPCPHVSRSQVFSETGNVVLCDECGADMTQVDAISESK